MNFLRIRCHLIPAGGQDGQDGQEPNAKCFATLCVSLKTWETKWNMWNPRSTCHILVSYTHPSPDFQQMPAALFIEVLLPDSQTNSRILRRPPAAWHNQGFARLKYHSLHVVAWKTSKNATVGMRIPAFQGQLHEVDASKKSVSVESIDHTWTWLLPPDPNI